jgi:hypothetical protein
MYESPESVIRAVARAVREIDRAVVTREGDGPGRISALRVHGDRHAPDFTGSLCEWPEGNGWVVRASDAAGRSTLYKDVYLSDACLSEDAQGEIDAAVTVLYPLLRGFAEAAGIRLRKVPPG